MLRSLTAFLLSILMLLGSLVPQNDVEELGKLAALVQHYRYHAQPAHGGLSWGQFLAEHYGPGAASGSDPWYLGQVAKSPRLPIGHDLLPLQGHHDMAPLVYVVPAPNLVPSGQPLPAVAARHARPAPARYADADALGMLQPPRA